MSVRISKSGEHVQQGTVIYTADTESDISSLPIGCTPGSTCFCIETSTTYILNNQGEWKVKTSSGGEEGGGSAYPSADTRNFPIENDNLTFTTKSKNYNDITKAINQRAGTTSTYSPGQIADAITNLPTPTYQQKSVTPDFSSGNVNVTADSGYDALSQVTVQKDSNLIAENIKKDVTVHGITGSYEGGGGSDTRFKELVEGTLTSINDSSITQVGDYAFYCNLSLNSITLSECLSVGENAFKNSAIQTVSLPKITSIKANGFNNCRSLQSLNAPNIVEVGQTAITDTLLTTLNFANVTKCSSQSFYANKSVTSINFPKITDVGSTAFGQCTALEIADFGSLASVANSILSGCTALNTLILRKNSMVSLSRASELSSTQFGTNGNGGTLYVPESLVNTYKGNAKWAEAMAYNENNQILAIEGSPYENV